MATSWDQSRIVLSGIATVAALAVVAAAPPGAAQATQCNTPLHGTGASVLVDNCGDLIAAGGTGTDLRRLGVWEQGGNLVISLELNVPFNQLTPPTAAQIPQDSWFRTQFGIWGPGGPQSGTCYSSFAEYQGGLGVLPDNQLVSNTACQAVNDGALSPIPITVQVASFPSLALGGSRFCNEIDSHVPMSALGSPAAGTAITWGTSMPGFFAYAAVSEDYDDGTNFDQTPVPPSTAQGTFTVGQAFNVLQGMPVLTATPGSADIALTWTETDNLAAPTFEWRIYRSATGPPAPASPIASVPYATTAWTDTTATPGTTYTYWVSAVNCRGIGPRAVATAMIPPQPIQCTVNTPAPIYPGQAVSMTASGGSGYAWSAPNGSTTSGSGPTFTTTYSAAGDHPVNVISGTQSATCIVTVLPQPPLECTPPGTGTVGTGATFSANGGTGNYSWVGTGMPPTGNQASFLTTYMAPGTHTVHVYSGDQSRSCSVQIIDMGDIQCSPTSVTVAINTLQSFQATGGDGTFTWTAPFASPSSGQGATFATQFTAAGTYEVQATSDGRSGTCSITVRQPCGPFEANFAPSALNPRVGQAVTFMDLSRGNLADWLWDFGNGASATTQDTLHTFDTPGTYRVRLTVTEQGSGCSDSHETNLQVGTPHLHTPTDAGTGSGGGASAPLADAGPDLDVREGDNVTLLGRAIGESGHGLTFAWRLVQGPSHVTGATTGAEHSFAAPPVASPDHPLELVYELRVMRGGATSIPDRVTVRVHAADIRPIAEAGPDAYAITGGAGRLNGTLSSDPEGKPLTYEWSVVDAAADRRGMGHMEGTQAPAMLRLSATDTATPSFVVPDNAPLEAIDLQLTVSDGRWSSTDTVRIWLRPAPPKGVGFLAFPEGNGTFAFVASHPDAALTWDFGDGTISTDPSPRHTYTVPGVYVVRLTVNEEGKESAFELAVAVDGPRPETTPQGEAPPSTLPAIATATVVSIALGSAAIMFALRRWKLSPAQQPLEEEAKRQP